MSPNNAAENFAPSLPPTQPPNQPPTQPPPPAAAIAQADLRALTAEVAALRDRVAVLEARLSQPVAETVEAVAPEAPVIALIPEADAEMPQWLPARREQPQAEVNALLTALFALCLKVQSQDLHESLEEFEKFKFLTHSARKGSPLLHQELFSYKWKPVVQRVAQYLANPADPSSFAVDTMKPNKLDNKTDQVRLYLKAEKRMPPPITLRRDDNAGGALRIDAISL